MKKILYSLFIFFIASLFSQQLLAQHYYACNESGLLALHDDQDFKTSFATGRNSIIGKSFSLNFGYSPFKHVAVQTNFFTYKANPIQVDKYTDGSLLSGMIGTYYFFKINGKNNSSPIQKDLLMDKGILLDFYLGYGKGDMYNNYINTKASELFYEKSFLQGGLHWQTGTLGVDLVSKFGFLDYYRTEAYALGNSVSSSNIDNLGLYDTFSFRENSIRVRLHLKFVGVYMTRTWINHSDRGAKFIDNATHFGLILALNRISKNKES